MEDATTRSSSPVANRVHKTATVSLYPETPFSYAFLCLQNIFSRSLSDEHRAQALYQVFIEVASEIETTSQFNNVMARIAENLEPVTVAVTVPCPIAHNDPCTREHIPTPLPSPKKAPSSLPLPLAPPAPNTSSIDKVNKRKRFKNKNKKRKLSDRDTHIAREREDDVNTMIARYGSEPEMDSDGFYKNPDYGLRDALDEYMKYDDEISVDTATLDRQMRAIDLELMEYDKCPFSTAPSYDLSPSCISCGHLQIRCKCSADIAPAHVDPPAAPTPPSIAPVPSPPLPRVALPRARTEPLPSKPDKTSFPSRAQTAPPELSRNTLTARRCMTNDSSPSSFVKFMDVPVTMTREHIHDCLKDNRKWSTVDISNVEIFAIKNKDSTIVNVLKIKFKDDAQSSTAKRVLTTSISFGDTISRRCRPWYLSMRSN
ncbi:hypothetical protein M378DRAFT_19266 [Amanita muscaria Koide BX008]|uniref:Uncharacterized protein n=1 Tax=Amanita muscaria (strain Koide BX008) TaxID=946122 RepID=A0A0C2RUZ0_AMAMK|nr:hypothetical protein M378DRAFT_19266 [Amanita muscaria Koide BX008]